MACEIMFCSCSMCPYCGDEQCPHIHDHDNDGKYWVYILNRRKSCYHLQANVNTVKDVRNELIRLNAKPQFADAYRFYRICGELVKTKKYPNGYYPNFKDYTDDWVEITITKDSNCAWWHAVRLILNVKEHKFYYYDRYHEGTITGLKPWDGKLKFGK